MGEHVPGAHPAPNQNDSTVIHPDGDPDISPQGLTALRYAKHGWHVFPCWWPQLGQCACGDTDCHSPAKHPISQAAPHGFHDATTDLDQVADWWIRWPQANVAIALGTSGLLVLDVDGPDGASTLHQLEQTHGILPLSLIHI